MTIILAVFSHGLLRFPLRQWRPELSNEKWPIPERVWAGFSVQSAAAGFLCQRFNVNNLNQPSQTRVPPSSCFDLRIPGGLKADGRLFRGASRQTAKRDDLIITRFLGLKTAGYSLTPNTKSYVFPRITSAFSGIRTSKGILFLLVLRLCSWGGGECMGIAR
ncbi:hypothetical protein CPC08DRAFT_446553 [Agrocybe pediades]|nr:hypothetical protein CPC08DRAFT_446553 [Agrocybe pediades]